MVWDGMGWYGMVWLGDGMKWFLLAEGWYEMVYDSVGWYEMV